MAARHGGRLTVPSPPPARQRAALACLGLEARDLSFLFGVATDRRQVADAALALITSS